MKMLGNISSFVVFVAAVAGLALAVLEILRNHLNVDTHALLMNFGSVLGEVLVNLQLSFGVFLKPFSDILSYMQFSGAMKFVDVIFATAFLVFILYRARRSG